jgi:rifampicin phosphotransferase
VPPGFVFVDANQGSREAELRHAYAQLGACEVAVRSSAWAEDGDEASYAGVFETVLGVAGEQALFAAVERCLASNSSARARAYEGGDVDHGGMAVVVQRMVDARVAGVLFTLDPVDGAEDRWVLEAVAGVGETLVSGLARPDRYVVSPNGEVLERSLSGAAALLDDASVRALIGDAGRARAEFGVALDMEWAIDGRGVVHWLQARPITRAGALPLDELDTKIQCATPGFTRYNVGEILPGAITPLSASTSIEMIDHGFRRAYERFGVFGGPDPADRTVMLVSGHLFMNMRGPYLFAAKVAGGSKDEADRSLGGRVFHELAGLPARGRLTRVAVAARVFNRLRRSAAEVSACAEQFDVRVRSMTLDPRDPATILAYVDTLFEFGVDLCEVHMVASTWSGMLYGVLQGILTGGKPPTAEHREQLAGLLCGAGRVESADIGAAMQELAAAVRAEPGARAALLQAESDDQRLAWLRGSEAGVVGERFAAILQRHGHRCVRELELRERDWAEDPGPLVAILCASIDAQPDRPAPRPVDLAALPLSPGAARAVRWLLSKVHDAVRQRERCKSLVVRCVRLIKAAYLALGRWLVDHGRLPEHDRLYFLTRAELTRLAGCEHDGALARLAVRRRHVFNRQQHLRFAMIYADRPRPLAPTPPLAGVGLLRGTSVSRGVVEGPARVVTTPAEAAAMVAGEILIVPFTDAGWSPYFNLAAGLATEIGGTLSHGAVVAREVGLPAVVDLSGATAMVRTGQRVRLDADRGVLEVLDAPGPER